MLDSVPNTQLNPGLLLQDAYAEPNKSLSTLIKACLNLKLKAFETISRLSGLLQPAPKK